MKTISFTPEEIEDLLSAISEAQAELCIGDGFPEASAYNERLDRLADKLVREQ